MSMKEVAVLIHVYYPGSWKRIQDRCRTLLNKASQVIVTCPHPDVIREIDQPGAVILRVPNAGKDIGGKLAAFAYQLQFGAPVDYVALIHDKVSPQTLHADTWFDQLCRVYSLELLDTALGLLESTPSIGVVGSQACIRDKEYDPASGDFNTPNNKLLQRLIDLWGLQCKSYDYIAGTMFLARMEPYRQFFSLHAPLVLRKDLEKGNVMDFHGATYTHCWERLLCYIPMAPDLKLQGL
jgi:lipopolysaccharide biosynthesis protein